GGANRDVYTAALSYGYRCPWRLWGPWTGSSRYMIGVRLVASATRAIDDPSRWSANAGLEFEPIGSLRYFLRIRTSDSLRGREAAPGRDDQLPQPEHRGQDVIELAGVGAALERGRVGQAVRREPRGLERVEHSARPAGTGVGEAPRDPQRLEI